MSLMIYPFFLTAGAWDMPLTLNRNPGFQDMGAVFVEKPVQADIVVVLGEPNRRMLSLIAQTCLLMAPPGFILSSHPFPADFGKAEGVTSIPRAVHPSIDTSTALLLEALQDFKRKGAARGQEPS